ncbi:hypothetical protein L2K70_09800 [Nocardioides KLBMP 9356]|uniref:Glycosyl hydrolase n=1 Tax=Nocardioides potassii TaxID=2911371 RepID=A0ABS9HCF3_9ACTN|nr:hypothetical protein [Nocardioides potassii]MCF6377899.1 hypothetical protein [Nocardioides potassii]
MPRRTARRLALAGAAVLALTATACSGSPGSPGSPGKDPDRAESAAEHRLPMKARELLEYGREGAESEEAEHEMGIQGEAGGESVEARTASEQFAQARTAPGIVNPDGYRQALAALNALTPVGGAWTEVTNVPYNADDTRFRDYYSNSSGGSGNVTGRVTGLASDDDGYVYEGGANGGVFRAHLTGTGASSAQVWTPISDQLGSLSTGDLRLAPNNQGSLWLSTGEANTGATSYVGQGVYALSDPRTGTFRPQDKVGTEELDSTTINALRFDKAGTTVYAATSRGVWSHSTNLARRSEPWTFLFAPNPEMIKKTTSGDGATTVIKEGAYADEPYANAPYANIVNDIAVDPKDAKHIVAAIGWRSGALSFPAPVGTIYYNGFYESRDAGATWKRVKLQGTLPADDVGNVTLQYSADSSRVYAINQSPRLLNKTTGTANTVLDGVYVSRSGNPAGPWTRIATSEKLAASGSALKQAVGGKGYGPGIQAWYNQSLVVDPADPEHLFVGLEEVYESRNGGSTWKTIGPYWNFYFSCWGTDFSQDFAGCSQTTHSDQHSASIGLSGGKAMVYIGNDGGVYRRPANSRAADSEGHATDWQSLNDGSNDNLQYYAVGVGAAKPSTLQQAGTYIGGKSLPAGDPIVSGGLQDNGGSITFEGSGEMSSNFGGDGGDVLVDPGDGCNIVQEYVYLSMRVTNTCAAQSDPAAFSDTAKATTRDIAPPDTNARFIAPFAASGSDINTWIAGGAHVWKQTQGFAIEDGSAWTSIADLTKFSSTAVATAVAAQGNTYVAGWCGPCNNSGFKRGLVIGNLTTGTQDVVKLDNLPNRYIGGVAVDPSNENRVLVALGGFSRRFTEGPGAGTGHVYEYTKGADGSWTATNISGNLPDLPANSVKVLPSGGLLVGTDLAVFYRAPGQTGWQRLGTGLPLTTVMDVEVYESSLYVATHGRGIWKTALPTS